MSSRRKATRDESRRAGRAAARAAKPSGAASRERDRAAAAKASRPAYRPKVVAPSGGRRLQDSGGSSLSGLARAAGGGGKAGPGSRGGSGGGSKAAAGSGARGAAGLKARKAAQAGRGQRGGFGPPPQRKKDAPTKKERKARKPKKKLPSLVAESLPTNLEEQRVAFFASGCSINPVFEYKVPGKTRAQQRYGTPERWLLPLAKRILEQVLAEYGSETNYMERNFGRLLSFDEVGQKVHEYLEGEGLAGTINVNYIDSAASPTSMTGDRLNIRVPCLYREKRIEGTLAHEIGTHYTRRTNDMLQPWHGKKKRRKFRLQGFLETEEGLATLNNVLHESREPRLRPYIWQGALYYYCCCRSFDLTFSELYRDIAKYVDDPDRRWRACVRVFRGTRDTSQTGPGTCMCKDQVYLAGSVAILAARHHPACDFNLLFAGRLALEDVLQRGTMLRGAGGGATVLHPSRGLRLPPFYERDPAAYLRQLDDIAAVNGVDAWLRGLGGGAASLYGGAAAAGGGGQLVLPRLPSAGDDDEDDDSDSDSGDEDDENDDDVEA